MSVTDDLQTATCALHAEALHQSDAAPRDLRGRPQHAAAPPASKAFTKHRRVPRPPRPAQDCRHTLSPEVLHEAPRQPPERRRTKSLKVLMR
jgi:hypothetical protein